MAAQVEEAAFRVGPFAVPLGAWSSEHIVDGEEGTEGASLKVSEDHSVDQRWLNHAIGKKHVYKRTILHCKTVPLFQDIREALTEHVKRARAGSRSHRGGPRESS